MTHRLLMFAAAFFVISAPQPALAKLDCAQLNGNWSGSMRGLLTGATTMSIRNCRINWKLPDGRTNICRYSERAGKVEYSCSLGSRGTVAISGNKITMKNVYTARQHGGAYTVNVSKN